MLRPYRLLLLLMCAALLSGCERVIDLNLPEGDRLLVVEARLERVLGNISGDQKITLSTTGSYFEPLSPNPARDAVVRVTDSDGVVTNFNESSPGTYTTHALTVVRNRTYALSIDWNGQHYDATETTQAVPNIRRLYFADPKPGRYSGDEGVRATIDFQDRAGERNYYLWDQYVNGVRQLGPDSTVKLRITATDEGYDGLVISGFQPYEGIIIPAGAGVLLRQIALSEQMYRFYLALSDQVSQDGSPFSVPPSSLRGNVANRTDRARPALGYFYVSEVSEARATYQP